MRNAEGKSSGKTDGPSGWRPGRLPRIFDSFEDQVVDLFSDTSRLRRLVPPFILLLLAWMSLRWLPSLDPASARLVEISPYLAAAVGVILAIHFHRGRPLLLLLNIVIFYWCYRSFLTSGLSDPAQEKLYHALTTLLPLNAFLFTLLTERGAFTDAGKLRLVALGGEGILAYVLFHYNYPMIRPLFEFRSRAISFLNFPTISHLACLLFLSAAAGVIVLAWQRKKAMKIWIVGYVAASFIACAWIRTPHVTTIFLLAACLMVIAAILQESHHMAFRDDLTGIPSRRALNEAIYGLRSAYAIAMVDVDHFKKFNDTHGHEVGDQVLKLVAKKLCGVGGSGKAYRYGGEEFTILFPGMSAAEAAPHVEKLRETIADYTMILRGSDRPRDDRQGKKRITGSRSGPSTSVTVSIGLAEYGPELRTPEEVIIAADKALYKAKQQGRNQVCQA